MTITSTEVKESDPYRLKQRIQLRPVQTKKI